MVESQEQDATSHFTLLTRHFFPFLTSHFSLSTFSPLPLLTQHFLLPPSRLSVSVPAIIFLPCAPFRIRCRHQARSTRAGSSMLQVARHRRGRTRMDRERIAHVFLLQIQNQQSSIVIRQSLPFRVSLSADGSNVPPRTFSFYPISLPAA